MATIKSHTNIPQSRKLSEILPFESADQSYIRVAIAGDNLNIPEEMQYKHNGDMPFVICNGVGIPCWSLAALLEQLPYELCDDDGNSVYLRINKEDNIYQLVYISYRDDFGNIETDVHKDFVDACYEMILKLHELNLL